MPALVRAEDQNHMKTSQSISGKQNIYATLRSSSHKCLVFPHLRTPFLSKNDRIYSPQRLSFKTSSSTVVLRIYLRRVVCQ